MQRIDDLLAEFSRRGVRYLLIGGQAMRLAGLKTRRTSHFWRSFSGWASCAEAPRRLVPPSPDVRTCRSAELPSPAPGNWKAAPTRRLESLLRYGFGRRLTSAFGVGRAVADGLAVGDE
jgi:hypothetical protein